MVQAQLVAAWFATRYLAVQRRLDGKDDDRGDVPGWVMVTVMTAALVVAILAVFKTKITDAVTHAIDSVTGA
ncbi:MAG: hypothetical protein QOE89_120 [Pseudonocardiales bacterium]|nr:hypothetical protein [Pseudonocardiales bacterium]